jgi:hypothetical protein
MLAKSQETILKTYISLLQERGFHLQESQSLVVKLWAMVSNRFIKKQIIDESVSLQEICKINDFTLSGLISQIEYFKVSENEIETKLVEELILFLSKVEIETLLSVVKDLKSRKAVGQYFTNEYLIDNVCEKIMFKAEKKKLSSVIDFSSGVGDFLKPFLDHDFIIYGVELDPIVFELMLFNFIFQSSLTELTRTKLVLTIKQGDSLSGFKETDINRIFADSEIKDKFLNLIALRTNLLSAVDVIDTQDLKDYYQTREFFRNQSRRFKGFNWFIDYPELFFDIEGNLLENSGADYVVGNPPWIYYKDVGEKQYRKENLDPKISIHLKGKYNFSLPFIVLAFLISKTKGSLIVPQGILTESYANEWRKDVFKRRFISEIVLCKKDWFERVINEFCVILWDKKNKASEIKVINEINNTESFLEYSSIDEQLNHLRILPKNILKFLKKIVQESPSLSNFASIRRGLTLTRKYQNYYMKNDGVKESTDLKKIVRNNIFTKSKKNGIFNFQLYHSGENFVYDKNLLGAPGTEELFEQPKIIRRNRGKVWYVGLDLSGNHYVNDIFDFIIPKTNLFSIKFIYGYLCSSLIQLLAESLLIRDITSNIVRNFPFPTLTESQCSDVERSVEIWLNSQKKIEDFLLMRKEIDRIIFDYWGFSDDVKSFIETNVDLIWREIKS